MYIDPKAEQRFVRAVLWLLTGATVFVLFFIIFFTLPFSV